MFEFKSTRFLAELERRRNTFNKPIRARIRVSQTSEFWYFHEFGTATFNMNNPSGPYKIRPIRAEFLAFADPEHKYGVNKDGWVQLAEVTHPGVRPRRMVAKVLNDIREMSRPILIEALIRSGYNVDAVIQALIGKVMPEAKKLIVDSISKELPGTNPYGKLEGQTAAWVFEKDALIEQF